MEKILTSACYAFAYFVLLSFFVILPTTLYVLKAVCLTLYFSPLFWEW